MFTRNVRIVGLLGVLALLVAFSGLGLTRDTAATTQSGKPMGMSRSGATSAQVAVTGNTSNPAISKSTTIQPIKSDLSPALRSIKPQPPVQGRIESQRENIKLPLHPGSKVARRDPVLQSTNGPRVIPTPLLSFEGVGNRNSVVPPDTNGDVGPNHYVQFINLSFQIRDKAGNSLYGPANGNTLWSGFGGPCQTSNDGDPIVQYDQLADRWVMTQFAIPSGYAPTYQCFAVSQTGDPTGAWHRYMFQSSATRFEDYPHISVWPDAYYMTTNEFDANTLNFVGAGNFAYDRTKMLAGDPTATGIYFHVAPPYGGMLSSDLDGSTPPPAGSPALFVEVNDDANGHFTVDTMSIFRFHADFANPAASTFTGPTALTVASLDQNLCNYNGACIPQPGTTRRLDPLNDRIMYRLAYRNMGSYQTMVVNMTVDADGTDHAGIRWFEVRNPHGTPAIYQQGTYSPDANHRWAGSMAMDRTGNIAMGFSEAGSALYPAIMYTGRLVSDPLGTLPQGETSLQAGAGSQTGYSRWGDYSMLAVDPVDDCTFWYTNEYYPTTGSATWHTRIGKFKFPSCGPAATATATVTQQPTNTPTRTPVGGTYTPTATVTPCPMTFTDVHPTDYFYEAVRYLFCEGAISGYGDNTFRPFANTTRAQLSKIVVNAEHWTIDTTGGPHFVDVPTTNGFYNFVETAYNHGIISGYTCGGPGEPCPGTYFRPNANVTRGQLSKIIVIAEGWTIDTGGAPHFNDVAPSNPFYVYIETAYNHSIISGYTCGGAGEPCPGLYFRWAASATRGQISKIVFNAVTAP